MTLRAAILVGGILASRAGAQDAPVPPANSVVHARQLALDNRLGAARTELRAIRAKHPDDADAIAVLAYVEIWSGHPAEADRLARGGLAMQPQNVDLLIVDAAALRRLNRRRDALREIERASALAPSRSDVVALHDLIAQEAQGSEVSVTANDESWDNGRNPLHEGQLSLRRNTEYGDGILRLSQANRFGLTDRRAEVEAYPTFDFWYAAFGFGYAPDPHFYARTSASAELFATLPNRFEGSLGYRRLGFPNAVNIYTSSVGEYVSEYYFNARVSQLAGGATGTSVTATARRYFGDGQQYVGAQFTTGSIHDNVQTSTEIAELASPFAGADATFLFQHRWVLTARAGAGRDELVPGRAALHTLVSIGLGVRF